MYKTRNGHPQSTMMYYYKDGAGCFHVNYCFIKNYSSKKVKIDELNFQEVTDAIRALSTTLTALEEKLKTFY